MRSPYSGLGGSSASQNPVRSISVSDQSTCASMLMPMMFSEMISVTILMKPVIPRWIGPNWALPIQPTMLLKTA